MQIYMLITHRCNLSCKMCIRGSDKSEDMSLEKLMSSGFINQLKDKDLVVTGGEPTLHQSFVSIVKSMCKLCKSVAVTTNGTTDYYIDELKNEKNLIFQISLDGDEDSHDFIRGNGSFNKTWSTIEKIDKSGIKFNIASVVSRKNKDNFYKVFPKLLKLKNLSKWRMSYEMPFGSADMNDMMTVQEWNEFQENMYGYFVECLSQDEIPCFNIDCQNLFDFSKLDRTHFNPKCRNCSSGSDKLYIYPDFNVYPCTCLTDFCLGNLNETDLEKIISGDENKKFANYCVEDASPCRKCEYFEFCRGGCIGMSYHYFGRIGVGDIRCPIFRRDYDKKNFLF